MYLVLILRYLALALHVAACFHIEVAKSKSKLADINGEVAWPNS
jgi:hypothetical protein